MKRTKSPNVQAKRQPRKRPAARKNEVQTSSDVDRKTPKAVRFSALVSPHVEIPDSMLPFGKNQKSPITIEYVNERCTPFTDHFIKAGILPVNKRKRRLKK